MRSSVANKVSGTLQLVEGLLSASVKLPLPPTNPAPSHHPTTSVIAIAVSVFAHVSLMKSSASAKTGNYTPAASVSPFHGS